jgi:hypothetical protein
MTHNELVDYIVNELRTGTSETEIKNALTASGWNEADINENLNAAHVKMGTPVVTGATETKAKRDFLKRHSKAVIIMCIALLLLAGGAFAAYKFMPLSPERMLQQAALNMEDVHSFDFSGRITADITANDNILDLQARLQDVVNLNPDNRVAGSSTNLQFAIDFDGRVDGKDPEHPKGEFNFDVSAGIISVGMKMKVVDDAVFLRLDNIPKITEEISKYTNKWIKIDPKALSEEYGLGLNFNATQPELTEGQKKQIEELTRKSHLYNSVTRLENDTIDAIQMYRYALVIDKVGLKNYLKEVEKINKSAGGLNDTSLDALDTTQFKNVEVWIGKSDRMVHRISMDISQASSNDSIPSGNLHLMMSFSNYNSIGKIEAPTQFHNIQDVIKDITVIGEVRARDNTRLTYVQKIMTALELYYYDYGKYPKSLNNLKPKYLSTIPIAPVPVDGGCAAPNNTFVYSQTSAGQDYELNFCLGANTGGYKAGPHTARMKGIDGDILTFD